MKEAEKLLLECFDKCMKKMRPGYEIRKVDLLSKEILNNNSFGYIYDNRLGYSVGCAFAPGWGEDTVITITSIETRKFKKNMVFHLIPFMMIPKIGTVGISETVVVKENGAEPICDFPRKFILIDKS
jgi:Xaa-Pro dipeptidase